MTLFRIAGTHFLLTFAAGFVLGLIRVPLLEPRLGVRNAELLEMPVMLLAIVLSACATVKWFGSKALPKTFFVGGILAMIGVLLADIVVGTTLSGLTVVEVFTEKDPISGTAYYLLLVVFTLMPWVIKKRSSR